MHALGMGASTFCRHGSCVPSAVANAGSRWGGRTKACGLYFHGESYGWEVQIREGDFLEFGERCLFHERALRIAADIRADLERDGWFTPRIASAVP